MSAPPDNKGQGDLRQAVAGSQEALQAFWKFLDTHYDEVQADVRGVLARLPSASRMAPVTAPVMQDPKQVALRRETQRKAVVEGDWGPYQEYLKGVGKLFAHYGMSFEECASFFFHQHRVLSGRLEREVDPAFYKLTLQGLELFLGMATAFIGEGYLESKQDTIRELSTPILQVRDRILVLPLIGTVDTPRAMQATAALLASIRSSRALAVIIDVTGVPMVDSHVALHFVNTAESARLMGASVILTGISTETARSLVALGVQMREMKTYSNLQKGLEAAEKLL